MTQFLRVPYAHPRMRVLVSRPPGAAAPAWTMFPQFSERSRWVAERASRGWLLVPTVYSPVLAKKLRATGCTSPDASAGTVAWSTRRGRWVVCHAGAAAGAVTKIGRRDDPGLLRELELLNQVPRSLRAELLSDSATGSLRRVTTAFVAGRSPTPDDTATVFHGLEALAQSGSAHGDAAPWNTILTREGRAVFVDWEHGGAEPDLASDAAHYVLQAGALVDWWTPQAAVEVLRRYRVAAGPALQQLRTQGKNRRSRRFAGQMADLWAPT